MSLISIVGILGDRKARSARRSESVGEPQLRPSEMMAAEAQGGDLVDLAFARSGAEVFERRERSLLLVIASLEDELNALRARLIEVSRDANISEQRQLEIIRKLRRRNKRCAAVLRALVDAIGADTPVDEIFSNGARARYDAGSCPP